MYYFDLTRYKGSGPPTPEALQEKRERKEKIKKELLMGAVLVGVSTVCSWALLGCVLLAARKPTRGGGGGGK